jgi:hypothetical protein
VAGRQRHLEDGFFAVRFLLKRGRFGVYLRATSKGEYIYFSMDDAGKVSVRQRLQDMDELMLETDALAAESRQSHELLLCLRDNLFFARLDGETLFGGRVLLRGEPQPACWAWASGIPCRAWPPRRSSTRAWWGGATRWSHGRLTSLRMWAT